MDLGPHCIDEAIVLFGMPEAVFADLLSCRNGSQVDDYFEVLLFYPKLRVRLHSSYLVREPGPGFVIHGRKGTFLKSRSDVQESQLRGGMKPDSERFGMEPVAAYGKLYREGVEAAETIPSPRGNYGRFYDQLHRAIVLGEPPPVTASDGVKVMRILDAAFESQRTRAVVSI